MSVVNRLLLALPQLDEGEGRCNRENEQWTNHCGGYGDASYAALECQVAYKFARYPLLEGDGFEPLVPHWLPVCPRRCTFVTRAAYALPRAVPAWSAPAIARSLRSSLLAPIRRSRLASHSGEHAFPGATHRHRRATIRLGGNMKTLAYPISWRPLPILIN